MLARAGKRMQLRRTLRTVGVGKPGEQLTRIVSRPEKRRLLSPLECSQKPSLELHLGKCMIYGRSKGLDEKKRMRRS
jgi:hypothetical protein